jgi:hypothetical protein
MLQQQQDELQSLKHVVNETRQDVDLASVEQSIRETEADIVKDVGSVAPISKAPPPQAAADRNPDSADKSSDKA